MKIINYEGKEYSVKETTDWTDDFNKNFQPGDYVDQEIADYQRDVVPPRNYGGGYLQVGEPYSHELGPDGKYRATYNTFVQVAPNIWKYCGHCFAGQQEHIR